MTWRLPPTLVPALLAALTAAACASARPMPAYPTRASGPVPAPAPVTAHAPSQARASTPVPNPGGLGGAGPVERALGRYKVGKPYQVAGVWYVPAEQPDYDAVGTASWYGDAFHGRPTANGESFDMSLASAAHATLPLPSIVEVTNLENNKSLQLRVNDRGPFKPGRIIDVSRQAADELGFRTKGVAQVRVRYVGPAPLDPFLPTPGQAAPVLIAARSAPAKPPQLIKAAAPAPLPTLTAETMSPGKALTPLNLGPAFAVQAGAFANRGNAERAAEALKAIGPTQVREVQADGRVLYRVVVGAWPARDGAVSATAAVASAGFPDARVVEAS